jgi:hypothetical protein
MREVTRRLFLRRSAGVAGGAAIVGAPTVLADTAAARRGSAPRALRSPKSGVPREPVMAYVRDADRGEVTLVAGKREATYRDPDLVRRLLAAAPGR